MIDTHSHIYSEEFDVDREEVILRAQEAGVESIILPNIDSDSFARMLDVEASYPDYCHAAIGLHPTSVKQNYREELSLFQSELECRRWIAVGEIGIDLYWDKSFLREQVEAFSTQVEWAIAYKLPVIIHLREAFRETLEALKPYRGSGLRGVFHSFGGSLAEAQEILDFGGFRIGINGIVSFKKSGLDSVLPHIDLKHILLETDAPYLTPVPFRGKRNESAYLSFIAAKLSEIYSLPQADIDRITTENARELFRL